MTNDEDTRFRELQEEVIILDQTLKVSLQHRRSLLEIFDETKKLYRGVIDQLEAAKAAAEETAKAKDAFLAVMSHEIRTPMNGVVGMIDVLAQTDLDDDQRDMLETVKESALALLTITNDVLDFSLMAAGKMEIDSVPVSIETIVAETAGSLKPAAADKGLLLRSYVDPHIPDYVMGDPLRLRQILQNLAGNAIKFTEKGSVTIRADLSQAAREGRCIIEITVIDEGIGIPETAIGSLFLAFTQLDSSTTRRHGGNGLGLSICKKLTTAMGGEIWATSEVAEGSIFAFRIEFAVSDKKHEAPVAAAVVTEKPKRQKVLRKAPTIQEAETMNQLILVAEDNPTNRKVVERQLRHLGYVCVVANDGIEALELHETGRFALLLSDCHMPNMDGFELTRRLRRAEQGTGRRFPIVAITASVLQSELDNCSAAGMDLVLHKPLNMAELEKTLIKFLPGSPGRSEIDDLAAEGNLSEPIRDLTENAAQTRATDGPAVEPTFLMEAFGDDREVVREILREFIEPAKEMVSLIEKAFTEKDARKIGDEGHKLKSSCLSIGAVAFADFCEALEIEGKAGNWDYLTAQQDKIRPLLADVVAGIDAF